MFTTSPIPRLGALEPRGSAGMLGIVWGSGAWQARFDKVDGEVGSLSLASDNTLASWKKAPPPKATSLAFAAWQSEFFSFVKDWGTFKDSNPWATDANDAMLRAFEQRIYALRLSYDKLAATAPVPVAPVAPYKPPSKGDPLDAFKWVGIGILGVLGITAIRSISGR